MGHIRPIAASKTLGAGHHARQGEPVRRERSAARWDRGRGVGGRPSESGRPNASPAERSDAGEVPSAARRGERATSEGVQPANEPHAHGDTTRISNTTAAPGTSPRRRIRGGAMWTLAERRRQRQRRRRRATPARPRRSGAFGCTSSTRRATPGRWCGGCCRRSRRRKSGRLA